MKEQRTQLLSEAHSVAAEYRGNLTVRQLYYQLVARGTIENSQRSYKRLVSLLTDARLAGEFPFEWLMDRTRECRPGDFSRDQVDVESALDSAADELRRAPEMWLWRARWWGQPCHVSVWVEKEALAGVFEVPCGKLGVSWFVLRGYSSLSSLSAWVDTVDQAMSANESIREAVVLYFGDHDPDGWEIPRSAERNVEAIADVRGIYLPSVSFVRVALNREQIDRFKPPPFPAKETSSRFAGYVSEHGLDRAWELDALRPDVLSRLIESSVAEYFDTGIFEANAQEVSAARAAMRERMMDGWIDGVL